MSDPTELEFLEGGSYMSLATRKHSGEYVPTPVWFAPHDDAYYVFSAGNAGKVKRLRNYGDVRIAACTVTGVVTGDWLEAEAQLLETPADCATALTALRTKYGWQMQLTDLLSRISGKFQRRIYIRVRPTVR